MKYDFDHMIDRRNTLSMKWNVDKKIIPMWMADMDFKTAPEVMESIQKRSAHGVFGYSFVPKTWNDAICSWWKARHDFEISSDWLVFCTGVQFK